MTPRLILPGALALAAVLAPTMAAAQEVGIAGGWNTATLVFDPAQDRLQGPEHRPGFLVGAFVRSPLHRRADVRAEFLVSQKGVKELFRFGDELVLTDFEVPVLIQVNLHQPDASGGHLFAGPTFAFTMARYTWGLTSLLTDGDTGASLKNQTFSVSASVALWRRR